MITLPSEFPINYKNDSTIVSSPGSEIIQKIRRFTVKKQDKITIRKDPAKRLFDICFSVLFLVATSPLFLVLSVLVLCTSQGPVFYKSSRLGRGGKVIHCWKFRSMYSDAEERLSHLLQRDVVFRNEWSAYQKVKNDPRITPIGKFLRRTSLDEIPQFWNVLKGDLSVVGPRPPTLIGSPDHYQQEIRNLYGDKTETILSVRPGITGAWQTSGRSQISFEERCIIEEKYAKHYTFWQDMRIIAKTIPAVFFARGAF